MHLVQILLPIHDNAQERFLRENIARFGGNSRSALAVYTRAPAEGLWKLNENHTSRDDIVIFEVMVSELNMAWWREYRQELEKRFRQDVVMVRAQQTQSL